MSFNWSVIGSTISGITSALSAAGVNSTSMPALLSAIGLATNPNQSEELALCGQIMMAASNPALVAALTMKLVTEVGIPPTAAAVAMTLAQPGTDITGKVMQIEQLIKSGG